MSWDQLSPYDLKFSLKCPGILPVECGVPTSNSPKPGIAWGHERCKMTICYRSCRFVSKAFLSAGYLQAQSGWTLDLCPAVELNRVMLDKEHRDVVWGLFSFSTPQLDPCSIYIPWRGASEVFYRRWGGVVKNLNLDLLSTSPMLPPSWRKICVTTSVSSCISRKLKVLVTRLFQFNSWFIHTFYIILPFNCRLSRPSFIPDVFCQANLGRRRSDIRPG